MPMMRSVGLRGGGSFSPPPPGPGGSPARLWDAQQTWWVEPRAVQTDDALYVGSIGVDGTVGVWKVTTASEDFQAVGTAVTDDHNCPSVTVLPDGNLIVAWTNHNADSSIRYKTTSTPGDIASFGSEQTIAASGITAYTQLWAVGTDLHLISRVGSSATQWSYWRSTNDGASWSTEKQLMNNSEEYVTSRVAGTTVLLYITGHPNNSSDHNIRVGRLDTTTGDVYSQAIGGTAEFNIYTGSGSLSSTDFESMSASSLGMTRLVDGLADVSNPAALFVDFSDETDAVYKRVRWNGSSWDETTLTSAGDPVELSIGSNWYFGGATFITDADDVVLAKEGSGTWSVERWAFSASSWSQSEVAVSATDRKFWRPYQPLGGDGYLVHAGWYTSYTNVFAEILTDTALAAGLDRSWFVEEDWSDYTGGERLRFDDWLMAALSDSATLQQAHAVVNDGTYGLALNPSTSSNALAAFVSRQGMTVGDAHIEVDFVMGDATDAIGLHWGWESIADFVRVVAVGGSLQIHQRIANSTSTLATASVSRSAATPYLLILHAVGDSVTGVLVDVSALAPLASVRSTVTTPTGGQVTLQNNAADSLVTSVRLADLDGTAADTGAPTALRSGLVFDGSADGLERPAHSLLSGATEFTVAFWARHDKATISGDEDLFVIDEHVGGSPFVLWLDDPNGLNWLLTTSGGGSGTKVFDTVPSMQSEYHFALVVDAANGQVRGYVNGAEDANSPWSISAGTLASHTETYMLGRNSASAKWLKGRLRDFRIYTAALSAGQVASIAADSTGTDGITGDLALRLRLDDHPGSVEAGSAWLANDATANRWLWKIIGTPEYEAV